MDRTPEVFFPTELGWTHEDGRVILDIVAMEAGTGRIVSWIDVGTIDEAVKAEKRKREDLARRPLGEPKFFDFDSLRRGIVH